MAFHKIRFSKIFLSQAKKMIMIVIFLEYKSMIKDAYQQQLEETSYIYTTA